VVSGLLTALLVVGLVAGVFFVLLPGDYHLNTDMFVSASPACALLCIVVPPSPLSASHFHLDVCGTISESYCSPLPRSPFHLVYVCLLAS
jgi:hypothetical protein